MTENNIRTLSVLLPTLVALVFVFQFANKIVIPTPATYKAPVIMTASAPFDVTSAGKAANILVQMATDSCSISWVNGGNYVLAKPTACKGAKTVSMTIAVSAKPCAESAKGDFRSLTNSTFFKGDFGFYLGQDKPANCLLVEQMWGRTV